MIIKRKGVNPLQIRNVMKKLDILSAIFLLIGGINWGLVGLFDFDLIQYVFAKTWIDRVIYIVIGFSALYRIINWQSIKGRWKI